MATVTFGPELQKIAEQARSYPGHLLPQHGTGLCLFSAAFLGWNDAIHFARRQLTTTCVDIDADKLIEMKALYPDDWQFIDTDAFEFAEGAWTIGAMWDAVSVDTFTGDIEERSLKSLDLWCGIARTVVTATCSKDSWGKTLTGR